MATIKDVARHAGVAPSTVSHYFTGNAPVSDTTKLRIESAIRELRYRPNVAARSLRLRHTHTVGLMVPNIANPFFAEIVQAIGLACQQMGYALLLADSSNDEHLEADLLENLFKQHIDGLLIIHTGRQSGNPILDDPPRPVVFVDREIPGRPSVATDNEVGGRLAARHLIELGHSRFGILAGDAHVRNVQQRIQGFRNELKRHGVRLPPDAIIQGSQSFETGRDVQFLMMRSEPPTAVFSTNDVIALGAVHKLHAMGLNVPDDVSLMGFDNIGMSEWAVPALTTVGQDKREMGRQAVAALIEAIQSKSPEPSAIYVPPRVIVRGSTAPVEPSSNGH